jgi:hypothetical protein
MSFGARAQARACCLFVLFASLLGVAPTQAQNVVPPGATVKLGIVSFLTGPAAAPFGIPGRNGAEIMVEAMNAGKVPAPFNKVGFGGSTIEASISMKQAPRPTSSLNSATSCSATKWMPWWATSLRAVVSRLRR